MISDMVGIRSDPMLYRIDERLICNDTCIGLELEIENISRGSLSRSSSRLFRDFLSLTNDDSLRNGIEVLFSRPHRGANITSALSHLKEYIYDLRSAGETPELSERTSLHIHVDVRELERLELLEYVKVYMLFEKILFEYVGYSRMKNNYCRPLTGSLFEDVLYHPNDSGTDDRLIRNVEAMYDKYSAMNLKSILRFGSVEFRMHPGTLDTSSMLEWINILLSLKKYISNGGTLDDLRGLSYAESMDKVFGELVRVLDNPSNAEHYHSNLTSLNKIVMAQELEGHTLSIRSKRSRVKLENKLLNKYAQVKGERLSVD